MSVVPLDRAKSHAGRVPPHNLDAEQSLLGSMLLVPQAILDAVDIVTADDYYKPAHGHIHQAIMDLWQAGEPADVTTVADQLRRHSLLDAVGGPSSLVSLQAGVAAASSAARYARIISDHAILRHLIAVAGEIAEHAYNVPDDARGAVEHAEGLVFDLIDRRGAVETLDMRDVLYGTLERIERRVAGEEPAGVATGLHDLDKMLGGLGPGVMMTVAARPAIGKTQLGTALGLNIAEGGTPVLIVSAEMSTEQMGDRIIASAGSVDLSRVRSGQLLESDWPKLNAGIQRVAEVPLFLITKAAPTLVDIRAAARRLAVRLRQPPVVIVDYLQLLSSPTAENRNNEVAKLSWGLKSLALDLGTPVIVLSQLNRSLESRSDKRPTLADLRDSGAIEQDSDVVIGLYRDEVYNADTKHKGVAELIVLKNRHGRTGTALAAYQAIWGRFENMWRMA